VLTSDELMAVVRVHADRVHDALRRLGCGPDAAIRVVQQTALDLVDTVAHRPGEVGDPVGWWFARARSLARQATGGDDALPVGSGVLSTDANQVRLAEALESRPERERAALLMRDSYDLPPAAVATVLALDVDAASEVVAQARLAFLPALAPLSPLPRADHVQRLGALGRLAEGGHAAVGEATARRHAQACDACAAVLDAQERARRLLSGLTVVALPDRDREGLLARVEDRARALLPAAEPDTEDEWEDEPGRGYSLSLMALGLVLAVGAGVGIGALASRGSPITPFADQRPIPLVTAAPVISVGPVVTVTPTTGATTSPSPRVFLVTPSPTPTPSVTATTTPTATETANPSSIVLDPSSGPRDTEITVTGQGWTPGAAITVRFLNAFGGGAGATVQTVADAQGTFTSTIAAHDSNQNQLPGPHTVAADDDQGQHAEATFTVTN
jgi:DNA-directed RNA polymerase specialized sigma24 family protein